MMKRSINISHLWHRLCLVAAVAVLSVGLTVVAPQRAKADCACVASACACETAVAVAVGFSTVEEMLGAMEGTLGTISGQIVSLTEGVESLLKAQLSLINGTSALLTKTAIDIAETQEQGQEARAVATMAAVGAKEQTEQVVAAGAVACARAIAAVNGGMRQDTAAALSAAIALDPGRTNGTKDLVNKNAVLDYYNIASNIYPERLRNKSPYGSIAGTFALSMLNPDDHPMRAPEVLTANASVSAIPENNESVANNGDESIGKPPATLLKGIIPASYSGLTLRGANTGKSVHNDTNPVAANLSSDPQPTYYALPKDDAENLYLLAYNACYEFVGTHPPPPSMMDESNPAYACRAQYDACIILDSAVTSSCTNRLKKMTSPNCKEDPETCAGQKKACESMLDKFGGLEKAPQAIKACVEGKGLSLYAAHTLLKYACGSETTQLALIAAGSTGADEMARMQNCSLLGIGYAAEEAVDVQMILTAAGVVSDAQSCWASYSAMGCPK